MREKNDIAAVPFLVVFWGKKSFRLFPRARGGDGGGGGGGGGGDDGGGQGKTGG